jgi:hypothetical protein
MVSLTMVITLPLALLTLELNLPPVLLAPATDLPAVSMTHANTIKLNVRQRGDPQCQWHQQQVYAGVIDTGELNCLPRR